MMDSTFAPIAIQVSGLWIVKGGGLFGDTKSILQDTSLNIKPGQFVAIIGPNGAGKTTFFRSLIGDKPQRGRIGFFRDNGLQSDFEDFYDNPEYWMNLIGYIPVDNVMHEELTVRQSLMHIGQLRLPDFTDDEILDKINKTIVQLGFRENDYRLDQFVGTLSSGERKKINIAAELLTDPPLLLLDEPTSNLDPNAERDLMNSLKNLSGSNNNGQGPTILVITHTLETLDRCDMVAFIENSKLVDFGQIESVFANLKQRALKDAPEILDGELPETVDLNRFEDWAFIFDVYKTDEKRAKRVETTPPPAKTRPPSPKRTVQEDSFWRQFTILVARYSSLRFNDLGGIFTLLISGFVAGFLLLIAPPEIFLRADDASPARQTVVLLAILVVIMGAFNSHREISKEFRIYIHERTKGLKPLAYVMSKVVWLSVVIGIFSTVMIMALIGTPIARGLSLFLGVILFVLGTYHVLVSQAGKGFSTQDKVLRVLRLMLVISPLILASFVQLQNKLLPEVPLPRSNVEIVMIITLILTSIAAITSGLMLSAFVGNNNDRATQFVIAYILFNVILAFSVLVVTSPEFQQFFDTLEPFSVSYWGYGGISSSLSIYCWAGNPVIENFNSIGNIAVSWIFLIVHIFSTIIMAVIALRLQETWISSSKTVQNMLSVRNESINYVTALGIATLIIWGIFLTGLSQQYMDLTYFDRLFSSNRYAQIESINDASDIELLVGAVSQSACEVPGTTEQ